VKFDNVAQLLTADQRAICSCSFGGELNAMCQFRACEPGRDAGVVSWFFFIFFNKLGKLGTARLCEGTPGMERD
jgi:hypothetical protein